MASAQHPPADHLEFAIRVWEALTDGRSEQLQEGLPDRRRRVPIDARTALASTGGYLVDRGEWLRLPKMRERIRSWGDGSGSDWLGTIGPALLYTPEEHRSLPWPDEVKTLFRSWRVDSGPGDVRRRRPPERLAAYREAALGRLSGRVPVRHADVPASAYQYVTLRPGRVAKFRAMMNRLASPDLPAWVASASSRGWAAPTPAVRVLALLTDLPRRRQFADAFGRYCAATGALHCDVHRTYRGWLADPNARPAGWRGMADGTAILYRAWKVAVHCRTAEYLDLRYPGWQGLLHARVPLGNSDRLAVLAEPPPVRAVPLLARLPVPALWVWLWRHWVEPFEDRYAKNLRSFTDPIPANLIHNDPTKAELPQRKLQAFIELAAADVEPPVGPTPVGPAEVDEWRPAQRLLLQALFDILVYQEMARETSRMLTSRRKPAPWRPPVPAPPARSVPEPGLTDADQDLLDRYTTRLDGIAGALSPLRAATDLLGPPTELHQLALALGRVTDQDRRHRLTTGMAEALNWRLRDADLADRAVEQLVDVQQMLAFSVVNTWPDEVLDRFLPTLASLRPGQGGPLVASILRSIAIGNSKAHRYLEAQRYVFLANTWLEGLVPAAAGIKLSEARQQILLQSNGLHMRILEWLLSHPDNHRRGMPREKDVRLARLLHIAGHALHEAGQAYRELALIREVGLPLRKKLDRFATVNWEINTRGMYMRALLLRATLHAVEADSGYVSKERRTIAGTDERALRDAVPLLYQEFTAQPLTRANLLDVTRIALHYAFLNGLAFLPPANPDALPHHLARPDVAGRFDVAAASAYLLDHGHDAGILANITYQPVRAVLAQRSEPTGTGEDPTRPAGPPLTYGAWRREQDLERRLCRRFDPAEFVRTTRLLVPVRIVPVPS